MDTRVSLITAPEIDLIAGALGCNESPDVQQVIQRWRDTINSYDPDTIEKAQGQCRDGELEVDEGAIVSRGDDDGAYVMAWLWVEDTLCRYCDLSAYGSPHGDVCVDCYEEND